VVDVATRALPSVAVPARQLPRGTAVAWAAILVAAMWVPVLSTEWAGWVHGLVLVVPPLLAAAVWRTSSIAAAYLLLIAVYFGVSALVLGRAVPSAAVATVLAWSAGIAAGALLGAALPVRRRTTTSATQARWPHVAVVVVLQLVQAYLVVSAQAGYRAQVTVGHLTPPGLLGAISTAAPVITLVLLFSCMAARRRLGTASLLAATQIAVLTASGLRGAALIFLLAVVLGGLVVLPADSPWRQPRRLLPALVGVLVLVGTTFTVAAAVKSAAAADADLSSRGTQLVDADTIVDSVAQRLDLSSYLEQGLAYRGVERAHETVAYSGQARALVPRFLWPEKPAMDYGQQVAAVFYGATSGATSSTITTVGDAALNLGAAMPLVGVALGLVLCRTELGVRGRAGVLPLVLTAILTYEFAGHEMPLVLMATGALRDFLVVTVLWVLCGLVSRRARNSDVDSDCPRPATAG
jgi:cell division protein FtsW (lipid II flippase)